MEINQYDITMTSHYDITMGNGIARDVQCEITKDINIATSIHCDVTMSNDVAMCTNHGITMHHVRFLLCMFCFIPNHDFIMRSV